MQCFIISTRRSPFSYKGTAKLLPKSAQKWHSQKSAQFYSEYIFLCQIWIMTTHWRMDKCIFPIFQRTQRYFCSIKYFVLTVELPPSSDCLLNGMFRRDFSPLSLGGPCVWATSGHDRKPLTRTGWAPSAPKQKETLRIRMASVRMRKGALMCEALTPSTCALFDDSPL